MHMLSLLFLAFHSSCALYQDFEKAEINWWGEQNFKRSDTKKAEDSLKPKTESLTTFHKELPSTDGKAKLIMDETDDVTSISVVINEGRMSYRSGHSVDVIIDGDVLIWKVETSENKSSSALKFSHGFELFEKLRNKTNFKINLYIDGIGIKRFEFNFASP